MTLFTKIFRFLWVCEILFLFFIDRNNIYMVFFALFFLFILTIMTVIRILESRNEWRKLINEGEVEVKGSLLKDEK